jgi:hypothetical protein
LVLARFSRKLEPQTSSQEQSTIEDAIPSQLQATKKEE